MDGKIWHSPCTPIAMIIRPLPLSLIFCGLLVATPPVEAAFTSLWSLGTQNYTPEEFGYETGAMNVAPGSATALDDDYYLAGTYPSPILTVAAPEPLTNFERTVSSNDNTKRIHFNLTAAQANSTLRIRFSTHLLWGGWWNTATNTAGAGFGSHPFQIRMNNALIGSETITSAGPLVVTANAGPGGNFTPVAGANILEIKRFGWSTNAWVAMDSLHFEINPTALVDADGDGMPQWWEEEYGLNDSLADGALDPDHDGSTNLQEFTLNTRSTNPHLADTDGDGLLDGAEISTNPRVADTDGDGLLDGEETSSNPSVKDTDADGAPDAWEVRTGYMPNNASSTPPAFSSAIGIHFVSELNPLSALGSFEVTGVIPQMRWNNTRALPPWSYPSGTTADLATPTPGTLVNAAGVATAATFSWTAENTTYFSGNGGSSNQRLLDGMLYIASDTPASVTLSSIPYSTYDVLVYVGSYYDGARGYARLNDAPASDRYFQSRSTKPTATFLEPIVSDPVRPWAGNFIRYRNVTGASCNVKVHRVGSYGVGFHGIQVVDSTADINGNSLPDWWEFMHQITPTTPADVDGDGLSNAQEFTKNTNPRLTDTDGDGLSDLAETNTGTYVSPTDTGSNPLLADTDGDGISDGKEVTTVPNVTNPNTVNPAELVLTALPVKQTSSFLWEMNNLQLIWDHGRGHYSNGAYEDSTLMWLNVRNSAFPDAYAFGVSLRTVGDRLTYYFYSNHNGGFSASNAPTSDIYDADWGASPPDLRSALGFSGVGAVDISDRFRIRLSGFKYPDSTWVLTFEIYNLDTLTVVKSRSFYSTTISPAITPTNTWQDEYAQVGRISRLLHHGVSLYQQSTRLELTPAFGAYLDTDEDGMPDAWETANGLNPSSAGDATLDPDADTVSNVREFLAATNPQDADTDHDGAKDGVEIAAGSNPLLASSLPPYFAGAPAGVNGEDFNGNGMPDAWELKYNNFSLLGSADNDGDGMTNAAESSAGTDPLNPNSSITSHSEVQGTNFVLCWPQQLYKQQRAFDASALSNWLPSAGVPALIAGEYRHTYANLLSTSARRFFKVEINDQDTDGDGVSDWTENLVLHSNPSSPHSLQSAVPLSGNAIMSGDYAALLNRFQGANSAGGFPGNAAPVTSSLSRTQAARFLTQATFGPTLPAIEHLRTVGYDAWINEQFDQAPTLQSAYARAAYADFEGARTSKEYYPNLVDNYLYGQNQLTGFARGAVQGPDQLRQRVAFALSQILVASRRDANLDGKLLGMSDFYDIFLRHAFGNYHDILHEVALHPCMGRYLSHVGNQKANPAINQYPDENFAREVMQLFSIGLWELNPDGSRQVNGSGQQIPTYSNTEITQMARVFTGLWFSGHEWGQGGWFDADYATPMSMHADRHDFAAKTLLRGYVIPARAPTAADAMRDVGDAIRHLFEHPNTAPFIGKQLIQFLVSDNPSPAYIARVSAKFVNNGSGVRGDMKAILKAILLDGEARDPRSSENTPSYGRLKEPVVRAMAMGRAFGLQQTPGLLWWDFGTFFDASHQEPAYSPSVFNFYRPEYRPAGLLTANNLAGPVFQITDSYSCISFPNRLWTMVEEGFSYYSYYQFPFDLSRESSLAATPELLIDHLNTLLCAGQMTLPTRTTILNAINQLPASQPDARARVAIYLCMVSAEGAIMK